MKLLLSFLILFCSSFFAGCGERSANVDAPQVYDRDGVRFDYPGNWDITADQQMEALRYVLVESPGNALVIMQIYPIEDALTLLEFAEGFAASMKEEIEMGQVGDSDFGSEVQSSKYSDIDETFSITLLNQKVPHQRKYRRFDYGNEICFLIFQSSEEDLGKTLQGYEQITSSFRYLND